MDTSYLLGARPAQITSPFELAQQGMTLSGMADQTAMRRIAMQQAQQQQAAQDAINRALPQVMQANWSPESIQQAVQQNPQAAGPLLDMLDKKRKAEADFAKTNAETADKTASATKTKVGYVSNQLYAAATDPNLTPERAVAAAKLIGDAGLEKALPAPPFQTWQDVNQMRPWLLQAGKAAYEAEKQASATETNRHNVVGEVQQAGNYASEAERRKAETSIGYGNLGVAQGRLGLEKQNANKLQHIALPDGSLYTFDPSNGKFAQGTDANGKPVIGTKPLTEVQGNATAYGMRMTAANDVITGLEDKGFSMGSPTNRFAPASTWTNWAAPADAQSAYQAKLNFMTASLRKESGAAINQSEFDTEDKKYFPQPGDSKQVLDQKRQARKLAIGAMAIQAGPGAKNFGGMSQAIPTGMGPDSAGIEFLLNKYK